MTIQRIPRYPRPDNKEDYLHRLISSLNQEGVKRIQDFDILQLSNVPWVDVRTYGAKGNGSDATTAVTAAIDYANSLGGGVVYAPGGVYKITADLPLYNNTWIIGDGDKTIFDATTVTSGKIFKGYGSISSYINLSANADVNDITLSLASSPGWGVDDLLLVESDGVWGTDSAGTYEKAELVKVDSVSDSTVTLKERLYDSYTTANNAKVAKITPVKGVVLKNFKILGTKDESHKDVTGVYLYYAEDIVIEDVTCDKVVDVGIHLYWAYNVRINRFNGIDNFWQHPSEAENKSLGYGIAVSYASKHILIDGAYIENAKHTITIGGYQPCRFVKVANSFLKQIAEANATVDVHAGEEIYYENCHIVGALQSGLCHIVYRDCDIFSNGGASCVVDRGSTGIHHVTLDGCRIFHHGVHTGITLGAVIDLDHTAYTSSSLKINNTEVNLIGSSPNTTDGIIRCDYDDLSIGGNSKVYCDQSGYMKGIISTSKNAEIVGGEVVGSIQIIKADGEYYKIRGVTVKQAEYSILVAGTSGHNIDTIIISDNILIEPEERCIHVYYAEDIFVSGGNNLKKINTDGTDNHALQIRYATQGIIGHNRFNTGSDNCAIVANTSVTDLTIIGNNLRNCTNQYSTAGVTNLIKEHNQEN